MSDQETQWYSCRSCRIKRTKNSTEAKTETTTGEETTYTGTSKHVNKEQRQPKGRNEKTGTGTEHKWKSNETCTMIIEQKNTENGKQRTGLENKGETQNT